MKTISRRTQRKKVGFKPITMKASEMMLFKRSKKEEEVARLLRRIKMAEAQIQRIRVEELKKIAKV